MNYGDKSSIINQRKYKTPYNLHNMPLFSTKTGAYISIGKISRFFSVHSLGQFYRIFIVIFRKNINENIIGVIKGTYFLFVWIFPNKYYTFYYHYSFLSSCHERLNIVYKSLDTGYKKPHIIYKTIFSPKLLLII